MEQLNFPDIAAAAKNKTKLVRKYMEQRRFNANDDKYKKGENKEDLMVM